MWDCMLPRRQEISINCIFGWKYEMVQQNWHTLAADHSERAPMHCDHQWLIVTGCLLVGPHLWLRGKWIPKRQSRSLSTLLAEQCSNPFFMIWEKSLVMNQWTNVLPLIHRKCLCAISCNIALLAKSLNPITLSAEDVSVIPFHIWKYVKSNYAKRTFTTI